MRTPRGVALRVALVYAAAASAWILVSGWFAVSLPKPLEGLVEIGKGMLFVATTSVLLFLTISRWTDALALESRQTTALQRQLAQVVQTVPVGVVMLDGHTAVTFMNPTAEELLGVGSQSYLGVPFERLCATFGADESTARVGELLRTGSVDGLLLSGAPGASEPRAVIARAAQVDPTIPGAGWIVAIADYTAGQRERVRAARLAEGYRFVSEFAGVIGRVPERRQLLEQLCELAVARGGFTAAVAGVYADQSSTYVRAGCVGLGEAGCVVLDSMIDRLARPGARVANIEPGEVLVENDILSHPTAEWAEAARESGLRSFAVFSIAEDGVTQAALALFSAQVGYFGAEERQLVDVLRGELSFALDRLRLDARRLESEEALARSEENFRRLFDNNPQSVWVCDRQTRRFIEVNEAAVRKYGHSRAEFLAMTLSDMRPESEVALMHAGAAPHRDGLADVGFWTHHNADGREFPVHVFAGALEWSGRPAMLITIEEVARMG